VLPVGVNTAEKRVTDTRIVALKRTYVLGGTPSARTTCEMVEILALVLQHDKQAVSLPSN
jgi:hypothetical protein